MYEVYILAHTYLHFKEQSMLGIFLESNFICELNVEVYYVLYLVLGNERCGTKC